MPPGIYHVMTRTFKRIIAPIDGSEGAKKAARTAIYLAKHLGVQVVALYVVDSSLIAKIPSPEELGSFDIDAFLQKEGLAALDEVESMAREEDVSVEKKMVEGIPDHEIIELADRDDLIVMGSKGMTALDRILIGSVSEKVMHHADGPVMVVRE
jgi:nucleotide-binding universal stress UspA family protein